MRSHTSYSGPANTVSATDTATMPTVDAVMIRGITRRSACRCASGASPR